MCEWKKGGDTIADPRYQFRGQRQDVFRLSCPPVDAPQLVGEDHTGDREPRRQGYLEGIAFGAAGNRAHERQADAAVVGSRRKHDGGSPAGLLVSRLRIEAAPDHIALRGDIGRGASYHTSFPTGGPQSTSPWMFSSVICPSKSSSVGVWRRAALTTIVPPSNRTATIVPDSILASAAKDSGSLTARLSPHLSTKAFNGHLLVERPGADPRESGLWRQPDCLAPLLSSSPGHSPLG